MEFVYYIHLFSGCSLVNDASPHYRTYDRCFLLHTTFLYVCLFYLCACFCCCQSFLSWMEVILLPKLMLGLIE